MSWEMVGLVLQADLPPGHKLVMLGIANHTNPEGKGCWAANERLEFYSGYKERQVQRIIQSLEESGYIKRDGVSEYGTNIWDIQVDKLPMMPPFKVWREQKRQAEKAKKNPTPSTQDAPPPVHMVNQGGVKMTPGGGGVIYDMGGVSFATENALQMTPNPSVEPFNKNLPESLPEISQNGHNGHVDAKVLPADAGVVGRVVVMEDPWEDAFTDAPVQKDYLGTNRDGEYERGDPDGDDDPKTYRKMSPLELKIAQLTHSKSLTDAQRAKLSSPVSASYGNQLPQDYPSPLDEWRANPKLFSDYVAMCAKLIVNNSGRPASRSTLITTVRNYTRHKSGWLDYRDFKKEADAPKKQVEKKYYHKESTPSWMA